jgi:hypothetical protein
MEQQYFDNSASQFLKSLDVLSQGKALVRVDHFQSLSASVLPEDSAKVVEFSATQIGLWDAEWLFSPAATPDSDAACESEAWVAVWKTTSQTLMGALPVSSAELTRERDQVCLRIVAEKSLETNEGKPITRFAIGVLASVCLLLLRIGLSTTACRYCRRILFPLNTVGRANYRGHPSPTRSSV